MSPALHTIKSLEHKPTRWISRLIAMLTPAVLVLVLFAGGCSKEKIVAKVGKKNVTAKEFRDEMLARFMNIETASQRSLEERETILKNITDRKMKLQDAYRIGLDKDSTVKKAAEDKREQAAMQELYKVEIMDKIIPEQEIKTVYNNMGEEIRASHILIKTSANGPEEELKAAKVKADSVYNLLKGGASFEDLARTLSDDPSSGQNGGDLGYFAWGRMVDEFQEAAWAMKKGELSQPVKSAFGYHIIKLVDRRAYADRRSFEEEEDNIRGLLRRKYNDKLMKAADDYIKQMKDDNKLTYDYANIQKILDKTNDPTVPRNNSFFSNFTEAERQWVVASMKKDTIKVKDLDAELAKTRAMPQWRDQQSIVTFVDRMVIPKMLTELSKKKGLYKSKAAKEAYRSELEARMTALVEQKQVQEKINVADSTLQSYYDGHQSEFWTDSTAEVQEIYINVTKEHDEAYAKKIAKRAKKGENFEKLMEQYSDHKGTKRPTTLTSKLRSELAVAAFKLKVGEVSDPIARSTRAFSIIKLQTLTPPRLKTFEEARPMVERQLRVQQTKTLRDAWQEDMKKRYPVTINQEELIAALPMKAAPTQPGAPGVQAPAMPNPREIPTNVGTPHQ